MLSSNIVRRNVYFSQTYLSIYRHHSCKKISLTYQILSIVHALTRIESEIILSIAEISKVRI